MFKPAFTKQAPTSAQGYHERCSNCKLSLVWIDTTHGVYPGPDFCCEGCYEDWMERNSCAESTY